MRVQLSLSAKHLGDLYHYTGKEQVLRILRSGNLRLSIGWAAPSEHLFTQGRTYFSSMTRSRFGGFHYKPEDPPAQNESVMITLDGDAISDRYKVVPIDYFFDTKSFHRSKGKSEAEERIVSDSPEIPIRQYIRRVDFITRRDKDWKDVLTGSILLQLKKYHIPYAFYDNPVDWAHKRNAYAYTGDKTFGDFGAYEKDENTERISRHAKRLYDSMKYLLEAVVVEDYNDMSDEAQNLCRGAKYKPEDVLSTYGHLLQPEYGQYATAKMLAEKFARVLKKKQINSPEAIIAYLVAKAFKAGVIE